MARATAASTQRHASNASVAAPARPMVRDFSGGARAQNVAFDTRTAYDFLISAQIGLADESDLLPDDRAWLLRSRQALGPELLASLDDCFGEQHTGIFHGLASILVADREIRSAADAVAAVNAVGARGIARVVIRDSLDEAVPDALIERVLDRDPAAMAEINPHVSEHFGGEVGPFLVASDEQYRSMCAALAAWLPLFQEIEKRVARFADRDVAARRHEQRTLSPDDLIERVTGGLRWVPDNQIRRVILAPSYFSRPFNYIYQGTDWRLFAYPITDAVLEAADAGMPPPSVVRLYRTLGDPTRLRTLKLLADRDWYLTELATQLELSKPTMKHHLAQMRAAGLVTVTEEGSLTYYSLRRERLAEAGVELSRFIG